jgi:ribosomal protein S18 acetylase RimI-like enzyme
VVRPSWVRWQILCHLYVKSYTLPLSVISKEYRSQGIGKLLVQKCESLAKRKKCYRIRLESRNDRIDAHSFYKKIGFQQIAQVFEKKLCK